MPLTPEPEAKESKIAQGKAAKAGGCTASNKV